MKIVAVWALVVLLIATSGTLAAVKSPAGTKAFDAAAAGS